VAALEPEDGLWDFGLGGGRDAAAPGAYAGVVAGVCASVFEGTRIMLEKEVGEGFGEWCDEGMQVGCLLGR